MPIPLHISPFNPPSAPGGPNYVGALQAGFGMAQGLHGRGQQQKEFEQREKQLAEQRRQFDAQHSVSKGYLENQQGITSEGQQRRMMEEQGKLLQAFQHATATGDWVTAQRLQQEMTRRGLNFRAKQRQPPPEAPPAMPQQPTAPQQNPFDNGLGFPTRL